MNLTQFYDLPEVKKLQKEYRESPLHFHHGGEDISLWELIKRIVIEVNLDGLYIPGEISKDTYNAAVDAIHSIDRTAIKLQHRLGVDHG